MKETASKIWMQRDDIEIVLKEIGREGMDWIRLTHDSGNTVINLRVS